MERPCLSGVWCHLEQSNNPSNACVLHRLTNRKKRSNPWFRIPEASWFADPDRIPHTHLFQDDAAHNHIHNCRMLQKINLLAQAQVGYTGFRCVLMCLSSLREGRHPAICAKPMCRKPFKENPAKHFEAFCATESSGLVQEGSMPAETEVTLPKCLLANLVIIHTAALLMIDDK